MKIQENSNRGLLRCSTEKQLRKPFLAYARRVDYRTDHFKNHSGKKKWLWDFSRICESTLAYNVSNFSTIFITKINNWGVLKLMENVVGSHFSPFLLLLSWLTQKCFDNIIPIKLSDVVLFMTIHKLRHPCHIQTSKQY